MITTTIVITQGFFQEFIYMLLTGVLFLTFSLAYHYVRGIDYMQENHPDYKGEDFLDWGDDEFVTKTAGRDLWDEYDEHTTHYEGDF
jgi:hypothetical protein